MIQTPIPYLPVENLHPERFPGIRIELPEKTVNPLLTELPDGGCLVVYLQSDDAVGSSDSALQNVGSIRFAPDGSRGWERPLDMEATQGFLTDLCVFPDGSFAVAVRATPEGSETGPFVDRLVRFDPTGDLLWSTEARSDPKDIFSSAGILEHLAALADGSILAVGTTAVGEDNRVVMSRFCLDGTCERQAFLGAKNHSWLMDAAYHPNIGWAVAWREEDVASTVQGPEVHSWLGCFDEELEERWKICTPVSDILIDVEPQADGTVIVAGTRDKEHTSRPILFRYATDGSLLWFYQPDGNTKSWIADAALLSDGTYAIASQKRTVHGVQESLVEVLAADGEILGGTKAEPGFVSGLTATPDGGFSLILTQEIGVLPQPPYISSLWTDAETIVVHYDAAGHLTWRKTIDLYPLSTRREAVLPTTDGRMFVG